MQNTLLDNENLKNSIGTYKRKQQVQKIFNNNPWLVAFAKDLVNTPPSLRRDFEKHPIRTLGMTGREIPDNQLHIISALARKGAAESVLLLMNPEILCKGIR